MTFLQMKEEATQNLVVLAPKGSECIKEQTDRHSSLYVVHREGREIEYRFTVPSMRQIVKKNVYD